MNRAPVQERCQQGHRQVGAPWVDLPPHVWALVLCDVAVCTMHSVAHTCRALHQLLLSSASCTCARASTDDRAQERPATRAFWTHWRLERSLPPPYAELDAFVQFGLVSHWRFALRCGGYPSYDGQWAVRWASRLGHVELVELLLRDERVDPSADSQGAVRWASEYGHLAVVERLLRDARVDPSVRNQSTIR